MERTGGEDPSRTGKVGFVPTWVDRLDVPVWIVDPRGVLSFVNERALELVGQPLENCIGKFCYEVIAARDESGRSFCRASCPVSSSAQGGGTLEPFTVVIRRSGGAENWIRVLPIPVFAPDGRGPHIVHCALPYDRMHRLEEYLNRVATRTRGQDKGRRRVKRSLTSREMQILDMLSDDETLYSVADRLNISYVTVRNHVQHVLSKLGVHSIMEAVAIHLLSKKK